MSNGAWKFTSAAAEALPDVLMDLSAVSRPFVRFATHRITWNGILATGFIFRSGIVTVTGRNVRHSDASRRIEGSIQTGDWERQ
jgi:hypothetical protein